MEAAALTQDVCVSRLPHNRAAQLAAGVPAASCAALPNTNMHSMLNSCSSLWVAHLPPHWELARCNLRADRQGGKGWEEGVSKHELWTGRAAVHGLRVTRGLHAIPARTARAFQQQVDQPHASASRPS